MGLPFALDIELPNPTVERTCVKTFHFHVKRLLLGSYVLLVGQYLETAIWPIG